MKNGGRKFLENKDQELETKSYLQTNKIFSYSLIALYAGLLIP